MRRTLPFLLLLPFVMPALAMASSAKKRREKHREDPKEVPYEERIRIGFQAGLNLANYSVSAFPAAFDTRIRPTFILGGQAEIPVTGVFYFQPELRITQKGYSTDNSSTGLPLVNLNLNVPMLELPLLAKAKFLASAPVMPYFVLGPDFMLRLGGSLSGTDANGNALTVFSPSFDQLQMKTFALGVEFGGGAEFRVSNETSVFTLLRFTLGLTNETDYPLASAQYRAIQLVGGMNFAL